jgi:hypothetical protein
VEAVKQDDHERREVLADWKGRSVTAIGTLERHGMNRGTPYPIALVTDLEILLPTKACHDLGHAWIQHTETMQHLKRGDRFRCRCMVRMYQKWKNGLMVDAYSLGYPDDVERVSRPIAFPTVQEPAPPAPSPAAPVEASPIEFLLKLRDAVQKAGGLENVMALQAVIDDAGGWGRVKDLLSFLKL